MGDENVSLKSDGSLCSVVLSNNERVILNWFAACSVAHVVLPVNIERIVLIALSE
jgi:hypothetical protein